MGLNAPNPAQERAKNAAMVDERRARVASYKVRGFSIRQMRVALAEDGHTNPATGEPWSIGILARDLSELDKRWKAEALRDIAAWKVVELERLDAVERAAWEAWERGIGKKQKTITERNQGGKGSVAKARIETEELNGDPRYLAVILDCQQRRARLLGLDAPAKIEGSGPGGGPLIEVVIRDAVAKQSPIEEKVHVETDGRAEEPTPSE